MWQNYLRIRRIDLKSIFWLLFILLLIFTLLAISNTHLQRWMYLTGLSSVRPELAKVFSNCERFPKNERVNWNYLYYYRNHSGKSLVWCKVPKAGSTTLTKMFLRLAGAKRFNSTTKIHRLLRDFYPQVAPKLMSRRMKSSFKFVVVRDPFERLLSAYRDKLESYARDLQYRDGYYYQNYGKFMVKERVMDNSTVREPTWSEFVNYLIKTPAKRFDEHWAPITRLCSPCSTHFDAIVRMETFDEEIKWPLHEANIYFQIGWAHRTGTSDKEIIRNYFRNLTESQLQRLYNKYEKDFVLFGYSPKKYFDMVNATFVDSSYPFYKNLF